MEIAKKIETDKTGDSIYMDLNILPICTDLFTGREKELKKLEKLFPERKFLYIEGISGIGKTSLMLKWADILIHQPEYKDCILWIECQKDWTLDTLLMEINEWLVSRGEKSIKDYMIDRPFNRKEKSLYIINILSKKNYIIFIDDFQNIKQEAVKLFIDTVKHYMRNSHIYVISTESITLNPVEAIDILRFRIKGLEEQFSLLLLEKFFNFHDFEEIPDKEILKKIIEKSKGHPLFLKTCSGLIISKVSTIDDITEDRGIENNIGKIIFEKVISGLTDDEKKFLEILSSCRISLSSEAIREMSRIENFSKILSLLEDKMLIEKDRACRYLIQPFLKEYLWNELSEKKKSILHKVLAEYFEKVPDFFRETFYHRVNAGEPEKACHILEKNMGKLCSLGYYEEFIEKLEVLEQYIPLTENMTIMKANVLSIQGNMEASLAILEDIKNKITDKILLAEVYSSLAGLYMNICNFPSAIKFYEDSLEIFREIGNSERITKVINSLAFIYGCLREFEKASVLLDESFVIAVKDNNDTGKAYSLRAKGLMYLQQEEYEKAFKTSEEGFKLAKKVGSFRLISRLMADKIYALIGLSRYDEAFTFCEELASIGEESGDKVIIACSCQNFGRLFYQKGDMEKAMEFFRRSIELYMSMGNEMYAAFGEYHLALILEEKKEIFRAIELYAGVMKKGRELSFSELKIRAELRIIINRLKINELSMTSKDILDIKKSIPENFIRERIEINLILAFIYIRENKVQEKEALLEEALELSVGNLHVYGLAKTCYIMSKISNRNKQEKELLRKRAEENFKKLVMSEQRELNCLFDEIDKIAGKRFLIKTDKKEFIASLYEVEELRGNKENFELFIDIPGKFTFEKDRGEINIFKKKTLLSLLLFFVRNSGKNFVTEEIYKEIWGLGYKGDISDTEVRKIISRLRDLIEPSGETFKYILLREAFLTEKGKYYFNDKVNFCFIDEIQDFS